jgi:hypothetical protein
LANGWTHLGQLCRSLEVLAHKQLRRIPFREEENEIVRGYGERLAAIMLYSGNSWLHPQDDGPRIVDVFTNPADGKHLLVGIARPRDLCVLYPLDGVDILCRGAVLPSHEWTHPERLTDAGWKALLGAGKPRESPGWVQAVISIAGNQKKGKEK